MRKLIYSNIWFLFILVNFGSAQDNILGTEEQRAAGKQLYDKYCAQCHGINGDANSVGKKYFRPEPRDFTSGTFKFRTTESGELPTHNDITRSIKNGMPSTGMPAWTNFSNNELDNLAYYLKSFSKDFVDFGDVTPITIPNPPSLTEESIRRGRQVFVENQCVDCHGNLGLGDGPSAPTLIDQWDQPIRAADLSKKWTFRGGPTREDIYRTFTTGLDGSPMPSYSIQPPEDQWHLVNYVYSLGESEANYGTLVIAEGLESKMDISQGKALFQNANETLFPIVGQIVEPGRQFYPGVNAVKVKAVYDQEDIAIMLTWHDMSAETNAGNSPTLVAPNFDPNADPETVEFNDAVAILLPSKLPQGIKKPYFMFGDSKNSVDLWFLDLAKDSADFYIGKGSQNLKPGESNLEVTHSFEEGEWTAIFKRKRISEDGLSFEENTFIPIAFSIWDGFNKERGNKRGLTSWYNLYLQPMETESAVGPMAKYAMITLLAELGLIFFVRVRYKGKS